jgi:hypothetical protein
MEAVTVQYSLFYAGGYSREIISCYFGPCCSVKKNKENCLRGKEVLERLTLYLDI